MHARLVSVVVVLGALLSACPNTPPVEPSPPAGPAEPFEIPAEEQPPGDAEAGWDFLVNGNYIDTGIPESLYRQFFQPADESLRLEGRDPENADLPYGLNGFTTSRGNRVVSATCLTCHASVFRGELVVGLGASEADFTTDPTQGVGGVGAFLTGPAKDEFDIWLARTSAVAPYVKALVVGVNSADALGPALAQHRDPETLAWSDTPVAFEYPLSDPLPVDVPPWWRSAKKSSLYANGSGRGDHSRLMMLASTLGVDSREVAEEIGTHFPDVRAAISSIAPPAWPDDVDSALADTGRDVFDNTCARCHGAPDAYPNLFVPLETIGTDDALANDFASFTAYPAWIAASYYGEGARLEPGLGYTAPPLDGIWATAPFLHNASVPTLAALLDSSQRPTRWKKRLDLGDVGYDIGAVGWHHDAVEADAYDALADADKKQVYDTTRHGYSNAGHTFGDALSASDRAAVIEYLKTL